MSFQLTQEEFINRSAKIHKNKYTYEKCNYNTCFDKVIVTCPIHGDFNQVANDHMHGKGCSYCAKNKQLTQQEFIIRAKDVHNDLYDYSQVYYVNNKIKVKIICQKHGIFLQTPTNHVSGKQGCPICKRSKGEEYIQKYLQYKHINFIIQYKFVNCKNQLPLPFDFYLPDFNLCIEYDGRQHYRGWNGNTINLKYIKKNDKIKTKYCIDNNIKLIRIKYTQINEIINILESYLTSSFNQA